MGKKTDGRGWSKAEVWEEKSRQARHTAETKATTKALPFILQYFFQTLTTRFWSFCSWDKDISWHWAAAQTKWVRVTRSESDNEKSTFCHGFHTSVNFKDHTFPATALLLVYIAACRAEWISKGKAICKVTSKSLYVQQIVLCAAGKFKRQDKVPTLHVAVVNSISLYKW